MGLSALARSSRLSKHTYDLTMDLTCRDSVGLTDVVCTTLMLSENEGADKTVTLSVKSPIAICTPFLLQSNNLMPAPNARSTSSSDVVIGPFQALNKWPSAVYTSKRCPWEADSQTVKNLPSALH